MLSLAPVRYRNALAADGGPIARIECGEFPVRGRRVFLANASLAPGLVRKGPRALFSDADGTGLDRVASVARHKAVSEALERWAFFATVRSARAAEFGFDADPTTTGMSAFPGLFRRGARRSAVLEAVERFSLLSWWEGRVDGRVFSTDWPGVSALAIEGPFGGVTVVTWARSTWGWVYGHAAEESFGAACERAVGELARHEWILRGASLRAAAGVTRPVTNLFERRMLFFTGEEGHACFEERLATPASGPAPRAEVICDREIEGPWSAYATVWRFALRPPSDAFHREGERYFFL